MITHIDNLLPAGNIRVIANNGMSAVLNNESRGTVGEHWFYWKFRASFDAAGTYTFRFTDGPSIGPRGACVSLDGGQTWHWNGIEHADFKTESFTFTCDTPLDDVQFCISIPYLQEHLDAFIARQAPGAVTVSEFCRTRHGRSVELLRIGSPEARYTALLTSRHHCQEEMATFAMEGLLQEVIDHPQLFADFCFYAVPFIDKDGALEGDQGKRRFPHDHCRDYNPNPLYPETAAVMRFMNTLKPSFFMDMHCPWLRSGTNEYVYFVGQPDARIQSGIDAVSRYLVEEAPADFPFDINDNLPYGVNWNTGGNYADGIPPVVWATSLPWQPAAMSIEIPFANTHAVTVDEHAARHLGAALARSIRRFMINK